MAVYVIQAGTLGLYKVGTSADPAKRLADLQTASPFHLSMLHEIKGGRAEERRIHTALHERRARGEWFELDAAPTLADIALWLDEPTPQRSSLDPIALERSDPVGTVEIAARLGVARGTVDQWRQRNLAFPPPRWTVGGRPAWNFDDIEAWHTNRALGRVTT